MAIYCIQCGTSLPDDAVFCLKCGKQVKGGSASQAASSSGENELYRTQIQSVGRYTDRDNEADWAIKWMGGGSCTVTNRRLIFETKKGGLVQVFLRDIISVEMDKNLFSTSKTTIILHGFGVVGCKQGRELASQIQKAIQNM